MTQASTQTNTFICANTKDGFVTYQSELANSSFLYIIKGGPGTGKSTFMKKVANEYTEKGVNVELIHCSSDPNSLDGVYIKDGGILFFDGTKPHTQDLLIPGAKGQLIDLGKFWDDNILKTNLAEIEKLNEDISLSYAKAYSILKVAGELEVAKDSLCKSFLQSGKFYKYINSFCTRILKKRKTIGKINKRFLSAINFNGVTILSPIPKEKDFEIYEIKDSYNYILPKMLDIIAINAVEMGYNVTVFSSPLSPNKKEFIKIDELSIGIGKMASTTAYMKINTSRFSNTNEFKASKNRVNLYKKLISELIDDAVIYLNKAKRYHDELEQIYIQAMDFKSLDKFTKDFIKKL